MRLGIDADGVLADFDKSMVDGYNEQFGASLEYKEITHWDAFESLTGWTHQQWWDWVVRDHPRVFLDAPPLPGAIDAVRKLQARGHEICIISAKPKWAATHLVEWLHNHGVPYDEVHVTSKKPFVVCDVYVDDALHNCRELLRASEAMIIQYAAWPYVNGGYRVPGALYATSWHDVVEAVDSYEAGLSVDEIATVHHFRKSLQGVFS